MNHIWIRTIRTEEDDEKQFFCAVCGLVANESRLDEISDCLGQDMYNRNSNIRVVNGIIEATERIMWARSEDSLWKRLKSYIYHEFGYKS